VRAAPLASRWIERLLAAHEPPLTVAQYLALEAIAEGQIVGAALARRAAVSPAAVSQLLATLEEAGLLARGRLEYDRRRKPMPWPECSNAFKLHSAALRPRPDRIGRLRHRGGQRSASAPDRLTSTEGPATAERMANDGFEASADDASVAECQTCGGSFDECAYQVIVWGLGSFDSVECAEKAMRRRARQARAGQELVHAVSHQTAPAGPPPESADPEEQA